jgi:hypothetical protein
VDIRAPRGVDERFDDVRRWTELGVVATEVDERRTGGGSRGCNAA